MKYILILLILSIYGNIYGQKDTIYLNSKLKPTTKENHYIRREITKLTKNRFKILDYYNNGAIKSAGYSNEADLDHLLGPFISYRKDGTVFTIHDHISHSKGWLKFYDKSFRMTFKVFCKNGKKDGRAFFYDYERNVIYKGKYKDNNKYNGLIPFSPTSCRSFYFTLYRYKKGIPREIIRMYQNGNVAMKGILEKYGTGSKTALWNYEIKFAEYYDKYGKKIGECSYKDISPIKGVLVEYYYEELTDFKPSVIRNIKWYENSEVVRTESYDHDGSLVGDCVFENNYPYQGKYIEQLRFAYHGKYVTHNNLISYQEGQEVGREVIEIEK